MFSHIRIANVMKCIIQSVYGVCVYHLKVKRKEDEFSPKGSESDS